VAGQKGRLRRWNFGSQAKRIPSPALFALACLPCPGFDDSHPHPHPEYLTLFPDSDPSYITVYLRYTWHSSVHQLLRSSPRRAHTVLYYNLRLVQCERLSDKARPCTLIFPRRHIISHLLYRVTLFSNPPLRSFWIRVAPRSDGWCGHARSASKFFVPARWKGTSAGCPDLWYSFESSPHRRSSELLAEQALS
jgi:hypothetical protein